MTRLSECTALAQSGPPLFPKADVVMSPGNQSGIGSCFAQAARARCLLEHVNFEVGRDL